MLREVFHSPPVWWGAATGYASPGFEALLDRIDAELSSPIRDALIEQAWRAVLDDLVVVPLYRPVVVWAMRDSFQLPIGPINVPYFREAQVTSAPVH